MYEIYKSTEAQEAVKRLEKLEMKRRRRLYGYDKSYRLEDAADVWCIAAFRFAFFAGIVSIGDLWFSIPQVLMWSIYGSIFVGIPMLVGSTIGVKQGVKILYERTTIHWQKKRVNTFREEGAIFSVNPELVERWEAAVRRLGGNPSHESVSPQNHWGAFGQMNDLDQLSKPSYTDAVRKAQLSAAIDTIIHDEVLACVAGEKLTRQKVASIEAKEQARDEKAARERLERKRTLHDQEIVTALKMVGLQQVDTPHRKTFRRN